MCGIHIEGTMSNIDQPPSTSGSPSWWARMFSRKQEPENREELIETLENAEQSGVLNAEALEMMSGALEITDMQVRDVMIPRSQIVAVENDEPFEESLKLIIESGHSRFPVVGEDKDQVDGILLAKDLLPFLFNQDDLDLTKLLRPAKLVPESMRLNNLLKDFRDSRNHLAIVLDEYGSVSGLVTIEDVLELIVGEIDDEYDPEEAEDITEVGKGVFEVRALTPVEDFNEIFAAHYNEEDADTIGGLIMHHLGRMPRRNEKIQLGKYVFTVLRMTSRRIQMLEMVLTK